MTDFLEILSQQVYNTALKVTTIMCVPDPPSAKPLGCGVRIQINGVVYLVSAGHLLNLKDWSQIIVPGKNDSMIYLNGRLYTPYRENESENPFDFGVLKFSERQNKHFDHHSIAFCTSENIIVNHQVEQNGYYVIAGYPVSGVKKTSGKAEFHPMPVKFLTYPMDSKKYTEHGFDPDHFILVKYQRKVAPFGSNEKQITKELRGISGSGLWYVPDWNDQYNGIPKFYLVGIMVENHKNKGFLSALRIDFVTETIRQYFDSSAFDISNFDFGQNNNIYTGEIP